MATVRKRIRNGKVEGWVADYFDQSRKRHIKTFKREREAKAWLATVTIEVRKGVHTPENKSITVAEAAAIWLSHGKTEGLETSTLLQYRYHVDCHINPLLGGVKLAHLSTPMVEATKDRLLAVASRPMTRKVLVSLKSIIRNSMRHGSVATNAAAPVKVDAKARERAKLLVGRDIPSKEEMTRIMASAAARWRPLIVTAALTGMRASELRGLAWGACDWERRIIHVRARADLWGAIGAPKSAAGDREIPMTPTVYNTLREWRLSYPRGELNLVFANGSGNVESHANICNRGWYAAQIAAGVTHDGGAKYNFHTCRHFFASWAIEQGFSPKRLQGLLGHSSVGMVFDTYGHLFPSLEDDHAKFAKADADLMAIATKSA
jgi:integrase